MGARHGEGNEGVQRATQPDAQDEVSMDALGERLDLVSQARGRLQGDSGRVRDGVQGLRKVAGDQGRSKASQRKRSLLSVPTEPTALTIQALADRWETSTGTIGKMIQAGQLKAFVVGVIGSRKPRYRIPMSEVMRHENGEAPGGFNEDKIAAMTTPTAKVRAARNPKRDLPKVKEFF